MADTITTLLTTAGGAYLGKFIGPAAEAMGKAAWERAQQVGAKALAYLATVGREPQPVAQKLLGPMAQGAGAETDPALAELWAALLANAADPARQAPVHPGFADVLRQLMSADVRILQALYFHQGQAQEPTGNRLLRKQLVKLLDVSFEEVEVATENLQRLGLSTEAAMKMSDLTPGAFEGGGVIATTAFGLAFMRAVTPPTP